MTRTEDVPLRFRLGEHTLWSASLHLAVENAPFPPRDVIDADAAPVLPDTVEGLLMRSAPVAGTLPARTRIGGLLRYAPQQYERSFVDLGLGMEAYAAKFSAKSRQTIKRKVRKFAEATGMDGAPRYEVFRTADEMERFHALARQVSARSYQERLLDAGLPDNDMFRARMRSLAERDAARAWLLYDGDRPVAYLYTPAPDGVLLYQYLGHDPDYARLSPGTVLQWLAFEDLFAEGRFGVFDFTAGEGAHKAFFATGSVRCADIWWLRPTLRLRLLTALSSGLDRLSVRAVALLDRLGLKARIKRWLRNRA